MVNRINADFPRETNKLNESDTITTHKYASDLYLSRRSIDNSTNDDVIASLANTHENRRARQVTEWERMLRHHAQRTM